jgi:glycosyltransferase involved in cell wall biosynthesis
VGFYGALDDYTVDLELLIATARRVSNGTLLVIGPKAMEISRLLAEPNVCYLGPVTYEQLPNYAAHFDVGIMPWLQNDWILKCNPIKLREYLALGFPIVSMRFPELSPYAEHVYGADSHEEFLTQLDRALAESDPARFEARRESVRGESWESRAERVAELLGLAPGRA